MDLTRVEFDGKKPDLINEIDSVELKALASSREQVNRWSELALTLSGWNFTVIDISKVLGWYRRGRCPRSVASNHSVLRNFKNRVLPGQMKGQQVAQIVSFKKGASRDFFAK